MSRWRIARVARAVFADGRIFAVRVANAVARGVARRRPQGGSGGSRKPSPLAGPANLDRNRAGRAFFDWRHIVGQIPFGATPR